MREELEILRSELYKSCSELYKIESNTITVEPDFTFESNIELKDKERSCKIYPFFFGEIPKYVFEWDGCPIFEISSTNLQRQGELIINWVLEKSMPSTMQSQFPEIKLSELARYYERGEGIKGEFIESWNLTEETSYDLFSLDPNQYHAEKYIIKLIKEMRTFQLDKSLRIGTSLSHLILSRSKRQTNHEKIPHISIYFLGDDKMKITSNLNSEDSVETEVKYKGYLEEMVKKLLKEEIK
ncbi:hypothetical protein [Kordia sp.]|uniref:hypothetical protein n=1 Tax=Kordia sp. TaxID=1965332 RepID=UPI0025BA4B65|nr:hypothetical protein [Kordia sp.]MCH2196281.1 hypothetical protein [Kordia sp.]